VTGTPVVAASLLTNGVIQPDGWDETGSGGQPGINGSVSDASWIDQHEREIKTAVSALRRDWPTLQRWGLALVEVFAKGGRLLAAGNGGSAAEAQHLTAELVGRFLGERQPLSAICLSAETSSLTAIVNDYGIDEMFARQVQAHGRPGDVLMLLSTSGASPNVLRAAERASDCGMSVWSITGPGPNQLTMRSDDAITVQAPSTAAVQAIHLVAIHGLCAVIDSALGTTQPASRR
jgi:D-sedoheptulose 7-phosphate isomerase